MKAKTGLAPVINFALLTIVVCVYRNVLQWSKYPGYKNKKSMWELTTDIFQGLVEASIFVLVLYGIYFLLFRLFLRKINVAMSGLIFSVLLFIILFLYLNTMIAFGPGKEGMTKFLPFAIICFLLPITEYLINRILQYKNPKHK